MRVLILLVTALAAAGAWGQFYRWTDAEGGIHYGDVAPADTYAEALDLGECRTAACRREREQAAAEAQRRLRALERWLTERERYTPERRRATVAQRRLSVY